ncbi:hypothetical protein Agabi119p4_8358 [Agaricus bisporus var. burnettii]|uniref:Uncharacterized protein n=1 Tax=Agaricus bisporus var. burnettii TaxID=192524 RepID=A0A8H7C5X0_AGABI|nr:hypothetical protein Agabi119p4_8358 [Agaricus bisporus var. burnettii]
MANRERRTAKVNPRLIEDNSEPWAAQYQAKAGLPKPPTIQVVIPNPPDTVSQPSTATLNNVVTKDNVPHSTGSVHRAIILDSDTENDEQTALVPQNSSRSSVVSKSSIASFKRGAIEVEDSDEDVQEPRATKQGKRKRSRKEESSGEELDETHKSHRPEAGGILGASC